MKLWTPYTWLEHHSDWWDWVYRHRKLRKVLFAPRRWWWRFDNWRTGPRVMLITYSDEGLEAGLRHMLARTKKRKQRRNIEKQLRDLRDRQNAGSATD